MNTAAAAAAAAFTQTNRALWSTSMFCGCQINFSFNCLREKTRKKRTQNRSPAEYHYECVRRAACDKSTGFRLYHFCWMKTCRIGFSRSDRHRRYHRQTPIRHAGLSIVRMETIHQLKHKMKEIKTLFVSQIRRN